MATAFRDTESLHSSPKNEFSASRPRRKHEMYLSMPQKDRAGLFTSNPKHDLEQTSEITKIPAMGDKNENEKISRYPSLQEKHKSRHKKVKSYSGQDIFLPEIKEGLLHGSIRLSPRLITTRKDDESSGKSSSNLVTTLLVDDNEVNLQILRQYIRLNLYDLINVATLQTARGGNEAWHKFCLSHGMNQEPVKLIPGDVLGSLNSLSFAWDSLNEEGSVGSPATIPTPSTFRTSSENEYFSLPELKQMPIELVLLDIDMPYVTGVDLAKRIRASGSETVPILIAVTSNTSRESLDRYREVGIDACCSKPIDTDALRSIIMEFFGNS